MKISITKSARHSGGFSLLEVIVVVTIMVIAAGALAPMAAQSLSSARRDATTSLVRQFADASYQYGVDTLQTPNDISQLRNRPSGVPGWNGPYTGAGVESNQPGAPGGGYGQDAFGRNIYIQRINATAIRIRSAGENGIQNDSDDIFVVIDIFPALRDETLRRIATINAAIQRYNITLSPGDSLPVNWNAAFPLLVQGKFLPNDPRYLKDAFGTTYTADPPGITPVVKVKSPKLKSTP